jgi:protein-S-isoprenylcysteine O-methyltransferase Ste14
VRGSDTDNPRVRFPPPLFFALALLVAYVLNRLWPLPVGGSAVVDGLAAALCVAAVALSVSGVAMFRRSGTSVVPVRPASALVVSGPYRFTRNPMYVGLTMLTAGLALFMNTWWPILLLAPVLLAVQRFVVLREEAYLTRRFGEDYVAYMRRVRRWL